jgi:hypothetical protein
LSTGNTPTVEESWVGGLRQTFPGASAEQLLLAHRRALDFLSGRGLLPEALTAHEALEARSWALATETAAALQAPRKHALRRLTRLARKESVALGALSEQPTIEERLKALASDHTAPR